MRDQIKFNCEVQFETIPIIFGCIKGQEKQKGGKKEHKFLSMDEIKVPTGKTHMDMAWHEAVDNK